MITYPSIIILANIRWDALWEWSQILATNFAKAGYPTVCVETTGITNPRRDIDTSRKILRRVLKARSSGSRYSRNPANLVVYSPLVVPPTYRVFRRINQWILVPRIVRDLRRLAGPEPVVMAFTPTQTTLDILSELNPRLAWYHCVLNYEEIPGTPSDLRDTERRLLRLADVVTVDSNYLKQKHSAARPDSIHIESGVDFELFQQAYTGSLQAPVRTIYYFGAADERRFDFDLVREVAQAGFTVRMLGTLSDQSFARCPGVEFLGAVPHEDLPAHLRAADALIIPYRITAFSKGTFPAKTYECLATGKPIVATPLPDLATLSEHLYLAESSGEFVEILRRMPNLETPEKVHARIEVARKNSWEARFKKFEEIMWRKI
jgi:glycosyltransferase involved in cell wall biosynthesis